MKQNKKINRYKYKKKTTNGKLCNMYITIHDDGMIGIDKYVLSDKKVKNMDFLGQKFAQNIYFTRIGFRLSTLNDIRELAIKSLLEHNINPEDIL